MSEWKKVKIGEFLTEREGRFKPDDKRISKYQRLDKIDFSGNIHLSNKPTKTDMILVQPGDLVISGINVAKGAITVYQGEEPVCATIHYSSYTFDSSKVDLDYFKFFVKSAAFIAAMQKQVKGGIKTEIKPKHLLALEISIPDLGTQKKIVEEISSQLETTEQLSSEIEKQKSYAKQLRQNILQEAIEGKLTADWRKQHPIQKGNPDYDAQALLNYLQQKKESLKNDPLVKREKIRTPVSDTEKEFSIPNNWIWIRMGELCYPITKGTTPDVHEIKAEGEIPYLKMFNIVNQKIDFDYRPQYISKKVHDEKLTRSKVYPNDVIMNIVGPPMGKIAIITDEFPEWNLNQAMAIFRGYDISINPYIYVFLNSMIWFKYVHTLGVVGQENMSLEQCKDIAIPLPPLAEQKEIVARVEQHLQTITQLETQIATRETTTKQLMQSILKDAFEEG
ncbi:MAG: restriction endonuclease subunit S [Fibrobacter sp.]|nr:restriction endonuclease subunit S [Fibrobacter sp.]